MSGRSVESELMKERSQENQCPVCGEVKSYFHFILRCAESSKCRTDAICEKR
jgi:predicted RNA-binding Zn-ribbon protein involved in translation (DUF1610 family)